jgi:hypothetical protein
MIAEVRKDPIHFKISDISKKHFVDVKACSEKRTWEIKDPQQHLDVVTCRRLGSMLEPGVIVSDFDMTAVVRELGVDRLLVLEVPDFGGRGPLHEPRSKDAAYTSGVFGAVVRVFLTDGNPNAPMFQQFASNVQFVPEYNDAPWAELAELMTSSLRSSIEEALEALFAEWEAAPSTGSVGATE